MADNMPNSAHPHAHNLATLPCMVRVPPTHTLYDYLRGFHRTGGQSRAAELLRLAEIGRATEIAQRAAFHKPAIGHFEQGGMPTPSFTQAPPPLLPSRTPTAQAPARIHDTASTLSADEALAGLAGVDLDRF